MWCSFAKVFSVLGGVCGGLVEAKGDKSSDLWVWGGGGDPI